MDKITLYHKPAPKNFSNVSDLIAFAYDGKITIVAKDYDLRQRLKESLTHHIDGEHDGLVVVKSKFDHGAVSSRLKKAILETSEEELLTCKGVRQLDLSELDNAHAISTSARFALMRFSNSHLSSAYLPPKTAIITVNELIHKFVRCYAQLVCRTIIMREGCIAEFGLWSNRLEPNLSPEWATNAGNRRKYYEWLTEATIDGFNPDKLNWNDLWYDAKVVGLEEFRQIKAAENTLDSQAKGGTIG